VIAAAKDSRAAAGADGQGQRALNQLLEAYLLTDEEYLAAWGGGSGTYGDDGPRRALKRG
jgi:hypothetical protein